MGSAETRPPLRALRGASLAEGATLLVLLLVAVPLKRMADLPLAVSIAGPLHGAAFLVYGALAQRQRGTAPDGCGLCAAGGVVGGGVAAPAPGVGAVATTAAVHG